MKFSEVLDKLDEGKGLGRLSWNMECISNGEFIFKQPSVEFNIKDIHKTNLPEIAKGVLIQREELTNFGDENPNNWYSTVKYTEQLLRITSENLIVPYVLSKEDLFGNDWYEF